MNAMHRADRHMDEWHEWTLSEQENILMAKWKIPTREFEPHPAGTHTGIIDDVQYEGEQEYDGNVREQISVRIVSDTKMRDTGEGYSLRFWLTLSNSPRSNLYKLRYQLKGRELSSQEQQDLDPSELLGQRLQYSVVVRPNQMGVKRAYLDWLKPIVPLDPPPQQSDEPAPSRAPEQTKQLFGPPDEDIPAAAYQDDPQASGDRADDNDVPF